MERRVKIRDVRTLLLAEKDAFENWRYVYEPDLPTGIAIISVEFRRMSALARILKEHIVGAAPA
jgi:hypothetical protein